MVRFSTCGSMNTPDTERAESVSTGGGDWPDQGLVADATGEDCGQASQLRCRLAQRFWHLNCGCGFVDGYRLDSSYFVKTWGSSCEESQLSLKLISPES